MNEVKVDLPYIYEDVDRHGTPRRFVRRFGRKIRIREAPGTPEFAAAYTKALDTLAAGAPAPNAPPRVLAPVPGSFGWLAASYFASPEFKSLNKTSQRVRREIIESCLREPTEPGSRYLLRDCPYRRIDARHILLLRDRRADKPGAANNRLKYLSAMFTWAIEQKRFELGINPVRDVRPIRYTSSGFYTWTVEDVWRYVERHPPGTMAYLALCLMLFLGARRGDAVRLGPRNMKDGLMIYVPRKTAHVSQDESVKPILPPLAEAIRLTAIGLKTFLVTSRGQPFTDAGFGNKMREWCDEAGLPQCTSHGLKKIAATLCAEAGATDRQMMALFDWKSEKMANVYTARASKRRLAAEASRLLAGFSLSAPATDRAGAAG